MKKLILLGLLLTLSVLPFVNGCQEVEGALVMKHIVLTLVAPEGVIGQPTVPADSYFVYYATNPLDLVNKPVSQLPRFTAKNKPGMPGTNDSCVTDKLFPTGRTEYYKAVACKLTWQTPVADTTRADSSLVPVVSAALSDYAWRYYPPEPNEKPSNIGNLN